MPFYIWCDKTNIADDLLYDWVIFSLVKIEAKLDNIQISNVSTL